jgi:predicted metal-dependent peptidase
MSEQDYRRGMKWLDEHQPFFTSFVVALGVPTITHTADTAEVRLNRERDELELALNPEWLADKTDAEAGAVLAHEAYHVLLDHFHELTQTTIFPNHTALVYAHECIINDSLVNEFFSVPKEMFFGPELVGEDCSNLSTEEAYRLFEHMADEQQSQSGAGEAGEGDEGDAGGMGGSGLPECPFKLVIVDDAAQELADRLDQAMIDAAHSGDVKPQDVPQELADRMAEIGLITDAAPRADARGFGAGSQQSAADILMEQNKSLNLNWVEILAQINPKIMESAGDVRRQTKANWAAPRRKMAYAYPNVILPTIKTIDDRDGNTPEKKPTVLLALDFSGSIPRNMTQVLALLARSIPKDLMDVHAYTFSTITVPFDPEVKGYQRTASGGTDFSCVERVAKEMQAKDPQKNYPYVICMTDGEADFNSLKPNEQQLKEQWFWMATDNRGLQVMQRGYGWGYGYNRQRIFHKVYGIPMENAR